MAFETVKIEGVQKVTENFRKWEKRKISGMNDMINRQVAPMLEDYMKTNRPWQDRTGNARRGLKVATVSSPKEISIQLWHTVHYGVYLEAGFAGRYAILNPTLQQKKKTVYNMIEKYWRE